MSNRPAFEQELIDSAQMMAERLPETVDQHAQRYACLMIQARAMEVRKLAGSILVLPPLALRRLESVGKTPEEKAIMKRLVGTIAQEMAGDLLTRSHELEEMAKAWASAWPPPEHDAPGKLVEVIEPETPTVQ